MKKWQIPLNLILAFVFLSGLVGLEISPSADSQGALHPALAQIAAGADQQVPIIVQKTEATGQVEDLVSALGGTVVKDLHIINALAAELPASALLELAKSDGVRWVAPDAPLMTSDSDDDDGQCGDDLEDCPQNYYLDTLGVRQVWDMGLDGQGIAVAVIDSGIGTDKDFHQRLVARKNFYSHPRNVNDTFGHGYIPPRDWSLEGASSWVHFFNGQDHTQRKCGTKHTTRQSPQETTKSKKDS